MTDLMEFLRARLTEDEQVARGTLWEGSGNRAEWELAASATVDVGAEDVFVGDRTVADHIARHDPARVLREVEAKRAIIDAHEDLNGLDLCPVCTNDHNFIDPGHYPCLTLRLLAMPYADHPDYRQEWKP